MVPGEPGRGTGQPAAQQVAPGQPLGAGGVENPARAALAGVLLRLLKALADPLDIMPGTLMFGVAVEPGAPVDAVLLTGLLIGEGGEPFRGLLENAVVRQGRGVGAFHPGRAS
ncbi:MAG: hypothetical protein WC997_11775 [Porticoccaceae bacterium]